MPSDVLLECNGCGKMFKPSIQQLAHFSKRGNKVFCSEKCREDFINAKAKLNRKHRKKDEYSILVPKKTEEKLKEKFHAKYEPKNA